MGQIKVDALAFSTRMLEKVPSKERSLNQNQVNIMKLFTSTGMWNGGKDTHVTHYSSTPTKSQYVGDMMSNGGKQEKGPKCRRVYKFE